MSIRSRLILPVLLVTPGAGAQPADVLECDDDWGWRGHPAHACDIRELAIDGAEGALAVDAGPNGSIRVIGENRRDVAVRARVSAWGGNDAEARSIASEVTVRSDGILRAEGPSHEGRSGWSVSYELRVPRETDLDLETQNGGIGVAGVRGAIALEAHNGGISLDDVAGHVRGRTTNGAVDARLSGDAWVGAGLDVRTTNGGVRLRVPEGYSARLETGTVNGRVDIDFPVTVEGRIGREVSTTLGNGGALIRAATTNGHVRVSRSSAGLRQIR
jgi:hypothetical protein